MKKVGEVKSLTFKAGKWMVTSSIVLGMVTGCGSSNMANTATTPQEMSYSEVDEAKSEMSTYDSGENVESNLTQEAVNNELSIDTTSNYNHKVIKTGVLNIETEDFSKTFHDINVQMKALGGYMENLQIENIATYDDQKLQRAYITIRVPKDKFDSFINDGKQFGEVIDLSCTTEDVTSNYIDAETKLEVLEVRRDRLLEMISGVDKYEDLFKFEEELANVEYEINSYKGTLNHYDSLVDFATLDMTVTQVKDIEAGEPSFGETLNEQLRSSTNGSINILKAMLIFIIAAVPYIIIILPVALVIYYVCKRRDRKKATNEKDIEDQEK